MCCGHVPNISLEDMQNAFYNPDKLSKKKKTLKEWATKVAERLGVEDLKDTPLSYLSFLDMVYTNSDMDPACVPNVDKNYKPVISFLQDENKKEYRQEINESKWEIKSVEDVKHERQTDHGTFFLFRCKATKYENPYLIRIKEHKDVITVENYLHLSDSILGILRYGLEELLLFFRPEQYMSEYDFGKIVKNHIEKHPTTLPNIISAITPSWHRVRSEMERKYKEELSGIEEKLFALRRPLVRERDAVIDTKVEK